VHGAKPLAAGELPERRKQGIVLRVFDDHFAPPGVGEAAGPLAHGHGRQRTLQGLRLETDAGHHAQRRLARMAQGQQAVARALQGAQGFQNRLQLLLQFRYQ